MRFICRKLVGGEESRRAPLRKDVSAALQFTEHVRVCEHNPPYSSGQGAVLIFIFSFYVFDSHTIFTCRCEVPILKMKKGRLQSFKGWSRTHRVVDIKCSDVEQMS